MAKTLLQEIAAKVAKKQGITIKAAEAFVTNFFSVIREGLEADKQVKVRGLGTFKIIPVKPRESVNVNTGERVLIEGHDKLTFTPDSSMKELVNRPFSQFDTVELEDGVDFGDITTEDIVTEEEVVVAETPAKEEEPVKTVEPSKDEYPKILEEAVAKKELTETNIPLEEEAPIEEVIAEADNKAEDIETDQKEEFVDIEGPVVGKVTSESEEEKPTIKEEKTIVEQESVVKEQIIAVPVTPLVSEPVVTELEPEKKETVSETKETTSEAKETISATKEPELPAEKDKGGIPWAKVAVFVVILIVGIGVGLWLSNRNSTTTDQPQIAAVDTVVTDSIEAQPELATNTDNDGIDYDKLNSDPRVKYGAYTIEGIDTVVTLRPGQTMESYCRATLGSNMLCYFQALNDTTELSGGATMKVPKVKVKPKGK